MGVKDTMVFSVFVFGYFVLFHPGNGEEKIIVEVDGPAYEHTVKTIKDAFGDIFDCVDIYKQPAFDHPLLKTHTIQMNPTILPHGIAVNGTSVNVSSSQVGHMDEKCPNGSVPILRIPTTLAKTLKSASNFKAEDIINSHLRDSTTVGATYVADVRMSTGEYYGSIAELNVYGVPQTSANQLSSSAIWVINDGDGQRDHNIILAGWMVYPSLFGDTQTRLFTYWTADEYQETGCFNLECQGFVQVHPSIPLGGVIHPVSTYNGIQYVIKILIFKDPGTGNWWMLMGENQDQFVGYWPNSIFTTLAGHANSLRWGGTVYTSNGERSPPMGSGHYSDEGYRKSCFFDRVELVVEGNKYGDIDEDDILYYQSPPCYSVGYFQKMKEGRYFPFGGPGGC